MRAASKIGKWAYRRYRGRKRKKVNDNVGARGRRKIGHRPNQGNTKRRAFNTTQVLGSSDRTLQTRNLCNIEFGDNVDERQRNMINIRGFKICMEFKNNLIEPIYVNVAILHNKDSTDGEPTNTDFFRASGSNRGIDFGNAALTGLDYHCRNINTDKHVILMHRRYKLTDKSTSGTFEANQGNSYMTMQRYIPLKRQIRFDGNADTVPNGSVYLCWWVSTWGSPAGAAPTAAAYDVTYRYTTYYKETRT